MVTVSLKMPEPLAAEVAAAAHRRGVSKSALIRQAVRTLLSAEEAGRPKSALDLARDLAGAFEGPEDLATNPKYMEGFGE